LQTPYADSNDFYNSMSNDVEPPKVEGFRKVAEMPIEDGWEAGSVYEHLATLGGPRISLEKPLSGYTSGYGGAVARWATRI